MSILRYDKKRGIGYVSPWEPFDDWGWWFGDTPPIKKENWYDPNKYDLVPREDYKKTLIENKQREIDYLDEQRKKLEKELKELKT